jgi:multicomponent Na+:H+ antiporter subunit C
MIGLYCVLVKKNLVKIIIGMAVMEYAVNLFFIMLGYRTGGQAPIISPQDLAGKNEVTKAFMNTTVDPLPQALVLTSIVIGLGSLALMISLCVRIYEKYGTFDITEIRRLRG